MKYSGIDLHLNNCMVAVIDEQDRVVYRKRLANDLKQITEALEPYRNELPGVVVESTYNWYWLGAAFAIRFCPQARRFYDRKKAKTMTVVAMKAVAHKLARAAYYMMRDGTTFDVTRCFA